MSFTVHFFYCVDKVDLCIVIVDQWIAPRIMHYISFALHFICITFHLHLKIMPRQHEMHDTSRFKCHALLLFHEMQM